MDDGPGSVQKVRQIIDAYRDRVRFDRFRAPPSVYFRQRLFLFPFLLSSRFLQIFTI